MSDPGTVVWSTWSTPPRAAMVAFLASTLAAAALTPAVRALAYRLGALDHALTSRKIHGRPIPRLGGLAIVLAFYAPLVALLFVDSDVGRRFWADPTRALALFAGGLAIAALGFLDDLNGANAKTKLLVQLAVAGAMYALGFRIDAIASPFGEPVPLGWLGLPFTVVWIAGVVNAMNLIDGLDGLAGGVALVAIATTFAIAVLHGAPLMALFTAALGGAVLGFLFYNFNPASIFMGDTGSMFLGFVLATTAIQTNQKSTTAVAIVVPILALGLPIADTLLALIRRAARGAPLFSGDRGHIHHRLLALGLSHRAAVLVLYGVSLLLAGAALVLSAGSPSSGMTFLLVLAGVAYLALRRLGYIELSGAARLLAARRHNLETRAAIRRIGRSVRAARSVEEVWFAVRVAAPVLGARAAALHLPGLDRGRLSEGFAAAGPGLLRVSYGLLPERPGARKLELGFEGGPTGVGRDTEIAIELLCAHLSAALARVERAAVAPRSNVVNGSGDRARMPG